MNEDENPIARRWRRNNERQARWLARQSHESRDRIRAAITATQQVRQERGVEAYRTEELPCRVNVDVDEHYSGSMNVICQFSGSKNFSSERPPDGRLAAVKEE